MELIAEGEEVPEGYTLVTELLTGDEVQKIENFAVGRTNFALMEHLERLVCEHRWMKIAMAELTAQCEQAEQERDALHAEVERLRGELETNDWRLVETNREIDRTEEIIAELDDSDPILREAMEINLAAVQNWEQRLLEEIRGRREPSQHSEDISTPRGG